MKIYTVHVHITDQHVDAEVLALNESGARRLVAERFDGVDHHIEWVAD
jgi:hypothetical protein